MSVIAGPPCAKCGSFQLLVTVQPGQQFILGNMAYLAGSSFMMCGTCDGATLTSMKMTRAKDVVLCSRCEAVEIDPRTENWDGPLCQFCCICGHCDHYEVMEETCCWENPVCRPCYEARPGSCTCFQSAPCSYCTDEWNWEND